MFARVLRRFGALSLAFLLPAALLAAGSETQPAFGRRSIPAEPLRCAPFSVAFRSEYTRYSSLTRLVSRRLTGLGAHPGSTTGC